MEFEKVKISKYLKGLSRDNQRPTTKLASYRTQMATYRSEMAKARSHMANERTHLAYFRTSMSLMTFGITLNRFSIFLREQNTNLTRDFLHQVELVGLMMVILGIGILCSSLFRFHQIYKEIEMNTFFQPKFFISIISIVVILASTLSAVWMVMSRS
jgi:putative membrane protein